MTLMVCSVNPQWAIVNLMAAEMCWLYWVWRWLSVIWGRGAAEGLLDTIIIPPAPRKKLTARITNSKTVDEWRDRFSHDILNHHANHHYFITSLQSNFDQWISERSFSLNELGFLEGSLWRCTLPILWQIRTIPLFCFRTLVFLPF